MDNYELVEVVRSELKELNRLKKSYVGSSPRVQDAIRAATDHKIKMLLEYSRIQPIDPRYIEQLNSWKLTSYDIRRTHVKSEAPIGNSRKSNGFLLGIVKMFRRK